VFNYGKLWSRWCTDHSRTFSHVDVVICCLHSVFVVFIWLFLLYCCRSWWIKLYLIWKWAEDPLRTPPDMNYVFRLCFVCCCTLFLVIILFVCVLCHQTSNGAWRRIVLTECAYQVPFVVAWLRQLKQHNKYRVSTPLKHYIVELAVVCAASKEEFVCLLRGY